MCGRGATSACAASGRTNVVTRIAATCPSLLPHRVAATRQCSLSKVQQLCGQSSRSADPRLAVRAVAEESVATRETDGSWGSGLGDARARAAAARSRSCPDGSGRRPRGTAGRYCGRMEVPTNYLEEGSSTSRATAAGASPEEPSGPESAEPAGAAGVASSASLGSRALLDGGGVSRARSTARASRMGCMRVRASRGRCAFAGPGSRSVLYDE